MNIDRMFTTIDTHVAGEAFRVVVHSSIMLNEKDIKANHEVLQQKYLYEKEILLNEPRGHRGMSGCIVIPSKVADYGLLFLDHSSVYPFKYAGLLTSLTALLETGNLAKKENDKYSIETIHGIYNIKANLENQEVTTVYFESRECNVAKKELEYSVVQVDDARNYLIYTLPGVIPEISLEHLSAITKWGKEVTGRLAKENNLFDGVIMVDSTGPTANNVRSVTFERDGSILRSPGVDSTFAILTMSKQHHELTNHSVFGSVLIAKRIPETNNRFSIETQGFTTGMHQFIYDQTDPLKTGFLLK